MATGQLKTWIEDRGFGFIRDDDGGPDVFLHANTLRDSLINPDEMLPGDRLEYDVGEGHNGKQAAKNVRRA